MREGIAWVLVLILVVAGVLTTLEKNNTAEQLQLALDVERAVVATGPCGDQFVVVGLGNNQGQAAVAGQIVQTEDVGRFFQVEEEGSDGRKLLAIYEKTVDGKDHLHFRRVKP